ncbi:SDR family oxidoreductase [Solihabitans fulvus]|uniref:SDR family oxidoreductase n=1 Tax=Solihabitans fulvus TaxID=1892852 RepID=A0A5B2XDL8_9PSEU|nr:SDR family oxidoreductase [Solihabitans fulvus]KAA2261195.1 SDR family oxidoreductase [Solihabitans fulvus]
MTGFERFDLTGRVAVVVGGSRGMGAAMSVGLARAGAEVMVVSRKFDACAELAARITAETGRRAVPHACHIGHWAEVDALADAAYATFGRVDVLINNAGMSPVYPDVTELTEELYDKVLDVNLKGPFRLTSLVGSRMAATERGGSVIFVSSVEAVRPGVTAIPYAAAKAGINNLTLSFAHLLGPRVRVNCIMPGAFLTDVSRHWDMAEFRRRAQSHALRRAATADEVVGTALYLAGDASSFTTGAVLRVDGGYV